MPPPPQRRRARPGHPAGPSRLRRLRNLVAAAALVLLLLLNFGLTEPDAAAVRSFVGGADRWQVNPEFRAVALDYCIRASQAMRIRPAGVPARRVIMGVRSLPFLPEDFAVNPTSALHYQRFSTGPLSAYLHLCSEQDVPDFLPLFEGLGRGPGPTDADLRGFLDRFRMNFPVAQDAGAMRSVESIVRETDAGRSFAVRANVNDLLTPHVRAIALGLGVPTDPGRMTPDQQLAVLERLDGYVRRHDPELWRTKQVSDFCGGVWAQVFGPPYKALLVPALALHTASRFVLALLLLGMIGRSIRTGRFAGAPVPQGTAGEQEPAGPGAEPSPAERRPRHDAAPV